MKRISNTCNEASENGNIDGSNNNETRSGRRRRRRSLDDSISREDPAINANTADVSESDQSKKEPYASLLPQQQDFPESIENLDEKVGLPEYVKMHTNTLTFPEKLMITLTHVEKECARENRPESEESIGWVLNGNAFVVQNIDQFCATWLPMFFGQAKFSSFTRKLYRWGFRKINIASIPERKAYSENALFFGNVYFLRDDKSQLSRMKSVTAAKTRSSVAADVQRQAWMPPEDNETVAEENKPAARPMNSLPNNSIEEHPVQQPNIAAQSSDNVAFLLQQAMNLAALQSLLRYNPQADLANSQPPPIYSSGNPMTGEHLRQLILPNQNLPSLPVDMLQPLQQMALSAALTAPGMVNQTPAHQLASEFIFPQNLGALASMRNSSIPLIFPNQASHQGVVGWSSGEERPPETRALASQDPVEEERLRRVIEAFLQYCRSVQQQESSQAFDQNPSSHGPPP